MSLRLPLDAAVAADFSVAAALGRGLPCSCGRTHRTRLRAFAVEAEVERRVPELVREWGYRKPFLVMDANTERVQGAAVRRALAAAGFAAPGFVFPDAELVPDESALERLEAAAATAADGVDLWIAVGSGTLNDLVRYVAWRRGQPYLVVATAPSMDGYASGVSPLIIDRMKQTLNAQSPLAILADPNVLAAAPERLLAAGVGDVLGKYSALADWELGHIVTGEIYCPFIVARVARSRDAVLAARRAIRRREVAAVTELFNALIEVGIGMDYQGNSRPASGAEHHLSHFWEMQQLLAGRHAPPHGIQVAYGALLTAGLWQALPATCPVTEGALTHAGDREAWERGIRRIYGPAAPPVLALAEAESLHDPGLRRERLAAIRANWSRIYALRDLLPQRAELEAAYRDIGLPLAASDIEVSPERERDGLIWARDLRSRYTIFRLHEDLGLSTVLDER
ncbi:MAG: iron-containing alcohol dehydrogenase [Bacillota bacterium]|nr:iron-containing alcohol dehydrogenase [Bacillota bacterium]